MKKLILASKIAIGLALVFFILNRSDIRSIANIISGVRLDILLISSILLCAGVVANAVRWLYITAILNSPIGLRPAVIGYFEAMFFNQILPTGFGGDAVRILRAYDAGNTAGWATIGVLVDRAFGLLAVGVVMMLAFVIGGSPIVDSAIFPALAATATTIVVGAGIAAILGRWVSTARLPPWLQPVAMLLKSFSAVFASPKAIGLTVSMLAVSNALTIWSFLCCAKALGIPLGLWDGTIVLQGIILASLIPISIGGWGLREGAAVLLFGTLGIDEPKAVAIAVVFGLVLTFVGLIGAVVWGMSGYRRVDLAQRIASVRSRSRG